jgi:hypothetical protein
MLGGPCRVRRRSRSQSRNSGVINSLCSARPLIFLLSNGDLGLHFPLSSDRQARSHLADNSCHTSVLTLGQRPPGADLVPPERIRRIVYDLGVLHIPSGRDRSTPLGQVSTRSWLESPPTAVKRVARPAGHDQRPRRNG